MAIKNKLENKFHSYNSGKLSKGCAYCVKGAKFVPILNFVFISNCFSCSSTIKL